MYEEKTSVTVSFGHQSMPEKKTEVIVAREGEKYLLKVGNETIGIADYRAESSADGATELHIVIKGQSAMEAAEV